MPAPFKNWIDRALCERLAADLLAVRPDTAIDPWLARTGELDPLELKARVRWVADSFRPLLPDDWAAATGILGQLLPPPLPREHDFAQNVRVWPLTDLVATFGIDHPAESLPLLGEMTRRWSSEFAIRPFLVRWPVLAAAVLDDWVTHPDPHVRRLVSEGSRPRLPWGMQLRDAVARPEAGLRRIARLVDDPSPYVRRSVANHLGDIAKDHPTLAVETARAWIQGNPLRTPLVRHALRTLLKRGDPRALGLFGHDTSAFVTDITVSDGAIGASVDVRAWVAVTSPHPVRVDIVWQWPGTRGWCQKAFRAAERSIEPGEPWQFTHAFPLRRASGRTLTPGVHQLVLRVNGQDQAPVGFRVLG